MYYLLDRAAFHRLAARHQVRGGLPGGPSEVLAPVHGQVRHVVGRPRLDPRRRLHVATAGCVGVGDLWLLVALEEIQSLRIGN